MRFGPPAWDLQTVVAASGANSWGFFLKAGSLTCERYNDGTFLNNQRGTIAYSGGPDIEGPVVLVTIDAGNTVGDGSFVFKAGTGAVADKIHTWDVEGEQVYEYEIPATTRATTPCYEGGYLWWLEWLIAYDASATVRLMRSRCDLQDVTEIDTFELPEVQGNAGGATVDWVYATESDLVYLWRTGDEDEPASHARVYATPKSVGGAIDVTEEGWAAAFGWTENPDDAGWYDAHFPSYASVRIPGKSLLSAVPDSDWAGPEVGILHQTDNSLGISPQWPNTAPTGAWFLTGDIACLSVYGDDAQISVSPNFVRHDLSTSGDPEFNVEPDGDGEQFPTALFLVGPTA